MPEEEALAYASGCRANGRYTQIEVVTKRKRNGHWEIESRLPYPPNEKTHRSGSANRRPKTYEYT